MLTYLGVKCLGRINQNKQKKNREIASELCIKNCEALTHFPDKTISHETRISEGQHKRFTWDNCGSSVSGEQKYSLLLAMLNKSAIT